MLTILVVIMKEKKETLRDWQRVCDSLSPEDGIPSTMLERQQRRRSRRGKADHRALQLCKQVHLAIEGSLACDCTHPVLQDVLVTSVQPVAGGAAMLVTLTLPQATLPALDTAHQALVAEEGVLRAAVAAAIHRKRVPTLRFRVVPREN